MRIDGTSISMPNTTQQSGEGQPPRPVQTDIITQQSQPTVEKIDTKEKLNQAIDSMNEFLQLIIVN